MKPGGLDDGGPSRLLEDGDDPRADRQVIERDVRDWPEAFGRVGLLRHGQFSSRRSPVVVSFGQLKLRCSFPARGKASQCGHMDPETASRKSECNYPLARSPDC